MFAKRKTSQGISVGCSFNPLNPLINLSFKLCFGEGYYLTILIGNIMRQTLSLLAELTQFGIYHTNQAVTNIAVFLAVELKGEEVTS